MALPIYLTLIRIVMSPVFLIFYLYYEGMGLSATASAIILLVIMAICELTDFFDGFLARKQNIVTPLGKVLDPMADSIFRLSVFFTFTQGAVQLPMLLVLIFFFRDSIISTLRTLCALRGVTLAARLSGKIKAVVQASCGFFILILMIPYAGGCLEISSFQQMCLYATSIAAIYTAVSGIEYIYSNWPYIKKAVDRTS
jgi:CDP-diacylglycerol--glycerol-3-phosphate 3-phosphatidyltransferase